MFRDTFLWLDSMGDRINPVVVRDFRKLSRGGGLVGALVFQLCILTGGAVFYFSWIIQELKPPSHLVFIAFLLIVAMYSNLTALIIPPLGWDRSRWGGSPMEPAAARDECFRLTGLTPKQWITGCVFSTAIISIYGTSPILPLLVAVQMLGSFQFWPFALLLNFALLVQGYLLYNLSYEALIRSRMQSDVLSTVVSLFVCPLFAVPWIVVFVLGFVFCHWSPLEWDRGPVALFLWAAFPGTLLLICGVSWRLTLWHFEKRTPLPQGIVVNFMICTVLNLLGAGLFGAACFFL